MQLDTAMGLSGRAILVTGSSQGIGRTIAESFLKSGCRVAFNGRTPEAVERTVANAISHSGAGNAPDSAIAVCGDVTQPDQARAVVAQTLDAFGRLDVLVCNVGSGRSVPPGQEDYDEWARMLALNLLSTTNMVEAAHNALAASQGAIVCISSICGLEVVPGAPVTYGVAKAALNAYIRGMARPLGQQGIRINGIAPGNILFPGSVWDRKLTENAGAVELMLQRDVALRQLGTPQDVANLAIWLASAEARFATGAIYVLDGGQVRS